MQAEALPRGCFFEQSAWALGTKALFLLEGALALSFYPGSIAG